MATKARAYLDKQEVDRSVLELSRERINEIFNRFDHIAVAFSGGKDSTVVLNLALAEHRRRHGTPEGWEGILPDEEAKPWDGHKMEVVHYDEEAIPPDTVDYVRRVAQIPDIDLRWFCLPIRHVNACAPSSPWWFCWDPDLRDLWCREVPPEGIITPEQAALIDDGLERTIFEGFPVYPVEDRAQIAYYAPALFLPPERYGTVGYVMGIRADESMTRLRAVTRKMNDNYFVPYRSDYDGGNVTKCYPIYDWRTPDVWTAPEKFGWDYNRAYDLQELHGFHGSRQRIAPPFGAEPMQMLGMYATCWPELWDLMVERVPGAATAARYSRTELYSFRGRPAPAVGQTWKELIQELLERHDPATRAQIATRLQGEIKWHYSKDRNPRGDPILIAPHPVTGMSLEWIAMIAMRGDLKKRKVAGWELRAETTAGRLKIEDEYREAYLEWKSGKGESI